MSTSFEASCASPAESAEDDWAGSYRSSRDRDNGRLLSGRKLLLSSELPNELLLRLGRIIGCFRQPSWLLGWTEGVLPELPASSSHVAASCRRIEWGLNRRSGWQPRRPFFASRRLALFVSVKCIGEGPKQKSVQWSRHRTDCPDCRSAARPICGSSCVPGPGLEGASGSGAIAQSIASRPADSARGFVTD